jgi:hypothetical protein
MSSFATTVLGLWRERHGLTLNHTLAEDAKGADLARQKSIFAAVEERCRSQQEPGDWDAAVEFVNLSDTELKARVRTQSSGGMARLPLLRRPGGALIKSLLRYPIQMVSSPLQQRSEFQQDAIKSVIQRMQAGPAPGRVFLARFDSLNALEEDNPLMTKADKLPFVTLNECVSQHGMLPELCMAIAKVLSTHPAMWAMWCVLDVYPVDTSGAVQGMSHYAVPILFTDASAQCTCPSASPSPAATVTDCESQKRSLEKANEPPTKRSRR